ncbi:ATP-binding protein [Rhodospirillum centenum]|uniref:histidine kinase n=1 Tax=Rhodospirillum centenum (strain ATCC 51521 / SW) TaxID=414684 RepID=B6IWE9_RHOCS|nr:ATP-binding protein [Rhodospirillum centenum]ACJ00623.1 alkaline phosphatase synthesis sensor protein PhoR [Rhodospirillum centenum SW]
MSRQEIRPDRFVLIGVLLLAPTGGILLSLVFAGKLGFGLALAAITLAAGLTGLVLRMLYQDSRLIAEFLDQTARADDPVPAPLPNSAVAQTLLSATAQAQRRWLERLDKAERRVAVGEAVVEAMHEPLILIDPDRRVAQANAAARTLFGDRMSGRDLAVSLRNPAVLEAVGQVLRGGTSRSVEFALPLPVERVLEARVKPFRRPAASPAGPADPGAGTEAAVLLTLHDITVLKRSEQMRADFVANASHELRTPLATLLGFIETLRGPARDDAEARDRFLGIMHDQAGRMSRLVNDLMSLSRIELDEHTPPSGTADVAEIVRKVVAMLELRAAARKIRLRVDGPDRLPPVVGDEDQLAQVFQNLIDNALKYGREQTEVTVALSVSDQPASGGGGGVPGALSAVPVLPGRRRPTHLVAVAVIDRGDGIPRTHLPRLTERFYRVDPARSRALGGTGLGLAIVKHIVNRHRGRLAIDSEVGKGSTFTVLLPAATEEPAPAQPLPGAVA